MKQVILEPKHKHKTGFTLVEVVLFIAITGLMLAGVMVGSGASIARQRYKDSVQNFTEFMRSSFSSALYVENPRREPIYSDDICNIKSDHAIRNVSTAVTDNVSNVDLHKGLPGRTNCAYYGKFITFDEAETTNHAFGGYVIRSYDIVGKIYSPDVDRTKTIYHAMTGHDEETNKTDDSKAIFPEILGVFPEKTGHTCTVKPINFQEYRLQWSTFLETPGKKPFRGSIAMIRSPENNQIQTFYTEKVLQAADLANGKQVSCNNYRSDEFRRYSLTELFKNKEISEFKDGIDLCIRSKDALLLNHPVRNLHIDYRINNPTAINLVPSESKENRCL